MSKQRNTTTTATVSDVPNAEGLIGNEPTEATAVVESTDGILAGAEMGRAFEGHGDRTQMDEVTEAAAVVQGYADWTVDGVAPRYVLPMQTWAENMARWTGRAVEDAAFKITKQLISQRINRQASSLHLGSVSLDLNPDVPGRPQDLGHPSAPAVCFYEVQPGSSLYDPQTQRAMAVWYQPEVDELGFAVNPRQSQTNGRWYANDTFNAGYGGVVRYFPSLQAADEAIRELRRAVRTLATPRTADVPDAEGPSVYDDDDESTSSARKAAVRRSMSAF